MINTTSMLLESMSSYGDAQGRIRRLVNQNSLFQITKGLYETDGNVPGYLLSPVIYGPSYLSFDYALSRHGIIPEAVYEYTSATCGKGKKKLYTNRFGTFSYRDIPVEAFPYATELIEENGYYYFLATREKALCDKLYTISPVRNLTEMNELLFDDLRIDENEFAKLDPVTVGQLKNVYHSTNVSVLAKLMKGMRT